MHMHGLLQALHFTDTVMTYALNPMQDAFKQWLPPAVSTNPWGALGSNAAAGAAAGALSLAVVYPFEFATVRLAADLGHSGADRQFGQGALALLYVQTCVHQPWQLLILWLDLHMRGCSCLGVQPSIHAAEARCKRLPLGPANWCAQMGRPAAGGLQKNMFSEGYYHSSFCCVRNNSAHYVEGHPVHKSSAFVLYTGISRDVFTAMPVNAVRTGRSSAPLCIYLSMTTW